MCVCIDGWMYIYATLVWHCTADNFRSFVLPFFCFIHKKHVRKRSKNSLAVFCFILFTFIQCSMNMRWFSHCSFWIGIHSVFSFSSLSPYPLHKQRNISFRAVNIVHVNIDYYCRQQKLACLKHAFMRVSGAVNRYVYVCVKLLTISVVNGCLFFFKYIVYGVCK